MKKILFLTLLLILAHTAIAQSGIQPAATATMKTSSRLFSMKDDLTSVILIIPVDSTVTILDSDSTYFHVVFQDIEGYIFKKDAIPDKVPVTKKTVQQQVQPVQEQEQEQSRFSYLENKYGSNMAARLISGKIWKGMNAGMVNDSWGTAQKINRIIDGNTIKEEWIYPNTWLYFENNTLLEWGPVKK
jgi:hypothetical protein